MRLSVTALLVTLALCYYEANAVVCPALAVDLINFLHAPDSVYKLSLAKYRGSPEAVAAKIEVKQCVNKFSLENKLLISEILKKILVVCNTSVKLS
nr:secretoglobin family 1D member-like [Odocoileus virginianus texanus]